MDPKKPDSACDQINNVNDQASRLRDLARKGQPSEKESSQQIIAELEAKLERLVKAVNNTSDELIQKYQEIQDQLKAIGSGDIKQDAVKIAEAQKILDENQTIILSKEFIELKKRFDELEKNIKSRISKKENVQSASKNALKKLGLDLPSLLRAASGNNPLVERIIAASEVINDIKKRQQSQKEDAPNVERKTHQKEGVVSSTQTAKPTAEQTGNFVRVVKNVAGGADVSQGSGDLDLGSNNFERLYDMQYNIWSQLVDMEHSLNKSIGDQSSNLERLIEYFQLENQKRSGTSFDQLETDAEKKKKGSQESQTKDNIANFTKNALGDGGGILGEWGREIIGSGIGAAGAALLPRILAGVSVGAIAPILGPIAAGAAAVWLGRAAINKMFDILNSPFDAEDKDAEKADLTRQKISEQKNRRIAKETEAKRLESVALDPTISEETKKDLTKQADNLKESALQDKIEELQERIRLLNTETADAKKRFEENSGLFGNSTVYENAKKQMEVNSVAATIMGAELAQLRGIISKEEADKRQALASRPGGPIVAVPQTKGDIAPTPQPVPTPTPAPVPTPVPTVSESPVRTREPIPQPAPAPTPTAVQQAAVQELQNQGINDPDAIANVLAQLQAESNFKPQSENLNYSPQTLMRLFGPNNAGGNKVRVRSLEEAKQIVAQGPEAIGNLIYGGRMGNASDEGYKYRGRGLVQLTGKDNYARYGKKIGLGDELVKNPDLANDPQIAAKLAAAYYADKKVDLRDINQVSKATGHAAGPAENARRAQYAENFKARLPELTQSAPVVMAERSQVGDQIQMASLQNSSLKMMRDQAPIIVNAPVTNVGGGGQNGGGRSDPMVESPRPTEPTFHQLLASTLTSSNS